MASWTSLFFLTPFGRCSTAQARYYETHFGMQGDLSLLMERIPFDEGFQVRQTAMGRVGLAPVSLEPALLQAGGQQVP